MASKNYKLRGYASYAMVHPEGVFPGSGPDEYGGNKYWKISIHPSDETIEKFKATGTKIKLYDSNESVSGVAGKSFKLRRDLEKEMKGKLVEFKPPVVTFNGEPLNEPIGNGSLVECGVQVYDAGTFGKGTRLDWVDVLDLVEYAGADGGYEDLEEADGPEDAPF